MLYVTRNRPKDHINAADLARINKMLDEEIMPAVAKVEGVRNAQAYNSNTGDLVFILDVANMAVLDRVMADPGCTAVFGKLSDDLLRNGGEIMFDRPTWQDLYGKK